MARQVLDSCKKPISVASYVEIEIKPDQTGGKTSRPAKTQNEPGGPDTIVIGEAGSQ
jgi:hypothetical protein